MCLVNESDKTSIRVSPSQVQVDQLEGDFWKTQFHISRMTTSERKESLTIEMFHGCPGSGGGIE
jgi:hypothetical protein